MINRKTIERLLSAGRWILVALLVVQCELALLIVVVLFHTQVTGQNLQLPEPYESILFVAVIAPFVAVLLLWGLLALFLCRLVVKVHHGDWVRQIVLLFGVCLPFWGLRYYRKFCNETLLALQPGAERVT